MRAWIIIAAAIVIWPIAALAASVEVTVAKRGKDATEARELAIADAEQKAFRQLVEQRAPDRAEAVIKAYDPAQISALVQSYEVLDERMTDTSYRATLRMSFNDAIISQMLRPATPKATSAATQKSVPDSNAGAPIAVAVPQREATLILPVFRDERGIMLWDEDNQWRRWMNEASVAGKGKLVMPFGDPTDRLMIDSGNVTTASFGLLAPLAERYGAQSVVVVIAEPVYSAEPPLVNVRLRHLKPNQMEERQLVLEDELIGRALKKGARQVVQDILSQRQKAIEAATTVPLIRLKARMEFSRIRDWVDAQRRLQQIPALEGLEIDQADWNGLDFELAFRGSPEALGQALKQVDMRARKEGERLLLGLN